MNPTMSEDGVIRATLRIEFRIGINDLIDAGSRILYDEPSTVLTRALIERRLRIDYEHYGRVGAPEYFCEEWDIASERAEKEVPPLFPEFSP